MPAALIDHVEVATGGASAVYGSDAIAGVTNFIMKKNFEGVALQSAYGETGAARRRRVDVVADDGLQLRR